MHARALILAFGLVGFACTMDNPAFNLERGSGAADELGDGDGDPTGPEESGESSDDQPGDGDGDGDPNESSSDDPTTDGDCVVGTSCGPCQICDQAGECVIDVGGPCDGVQTHCADFLYGAVENVCYRLADVILDGRCTEQGSCEPSSVLDCPQRQGAVHFACDPACVTDSTGCVKLGKASEVEMPAMCAVGGDPGPDCKTICSNETGSAIKNYGCIEGECAFLGNQQLCGNYACDIDGVFCHQSCESDFQCAQLFACVSSQCQLP